MSTNIWAYSCLVPAGANPAITACYVGLDPVTQIRWRVPPGPRGHLSWYLAQSGSQVFPNVLSDPVVAEGEWDTWVLDSPPENPVWQLYGFNTGADDHSVYLQFFTDPFATTTGGGGGGDIVLTGFPTSDSDIPTLFVT